MRKFGLLIASLLFIYMLYLVQLRLNEDSVALISPMTEDESASDKLEKNKTLAWWEQQLTEAVSKNEWRTAAELSSRKAGYLRSINEPEQAKAADESGKQYSERDSAAAIPAFDPSSAELQAITIEPYVSMPYTETRTLSKFEPQTGVYLGMLGADKRVGFNINNIEQVYGRKHAIYLSYVGWRKVQSNPTSYFPIRTAETVKALGGALQIGWEPRYGLDDVKDDEYVRTFAREAKASGIPVFLRYASEMNGAWVPWHGEPQKYIEKFRLIHKIMKEEAPNVVMVWSPNFMPMNNIDDYYPGDEYVDWIGYSLYATGGPGEKIDDKSGFLQSFQPLSDKYPGKPIMISEGAVSHYNLTTNQSYERWAEGQLGDLYAYLTRMYPRVKAITYFNFGKERAIRSKMDAVYDLGENPFADLLYRRSIQHDLYLSRVEEGARTNGNSVYIPWSQASKLEGMHKLFTRVSIPQSKHPFAVGYYQGGKQLGMTYELPWEIKLDFSKLDLNQPLTITAFNRNMEELAKTTVELPK
ncbi:MAG: copper amine oxidase domain protein [Paenibacillus sp.]|jgi:hypothetical protein|nr:copper amine oxidase domain protein [Paenibacillus sp.]